MKPHRMRMAHSLILNYGLDKYMHILVCFLLSQQRPPRATREQMMRFHTDEYIDFLSRVSPETAQELTGDGTRCTWYTLTFRLDWRGLPCV